MEPKIIFKVDLSVTDAASNPLPYARGVEADYIKYTRSTFIPGLVHENHVLKHGDEIVLYGQQAKYFYNLIQKRLLQPLKVVRIADFFFESGFGGLLYGGEADSEYLHNDGNIYDVEANESIHLSLEDGDLIEDETVTYILVLEYFPTVIVSGVAEVDVFSIE